MFGLVLIHYSAFFCSEGHVALDRNPQQGYDTLLLRMIPGYKTKKQNILNRKALQ